MKEDALTHLRTCNERNDQTGLLLKEDGEVAQRRHIAAQRQHLHGCLHIRDNLAIVCKAILLGNGATSQTLHGFSLCPVWAVFGFFENGEQEAQKENFISRVRLVNANPAD
eukprot:3986537-Amphidinium_carterae.1